MKILNRKKQEATVYRIIGNSLMMWEMIVRAHLPHDEYVDLMKHFVDNTVYAAKSVMGERGVAWVCAMLGTIYGIDEFRVENIGHNDVDG